MLLLIAKQFKIHSMIVYFEAQYHFRHSFFFILMIFCLPLIKSTVMLTAVTSTRVCSIRADRQMPQRHIHVSFLWPNIPHFHMRDNWLQNASSFTIMKWFTKMTWNEIDLPKGKTHFSLASLTAKSWASSSGQCLSYINLLNLCFFRDICIYRVKV